MRLELQSCYVTVHVTGTSALDIANARTLKTAVSFLQQNKLNVITKDTIHNKREVQTK